MCILLIMPEHHRGAGYYGDCGKRQNHAAVLQKGLYRPDYVIAWASKRATLRVRSRLAGHLLRSPYSYCDVHSKGELLSLLSNGLECLESIYDGQLYKTLENFSRGLPGL